MTDSVASVGFLLDDAQPPDPDQRAALEASDRLGVSLEECSPGQLLGIDDAPDWDVLWWHRGRPIDDLQWLSDARPTIEDHLEGGGGLLLSGRALEAIEPLGIDPVGPAPYLHEGPTGLLCKSLYHDHALFDGFDDLRIETAAHPVPGEEARYGPVLPERGEVLASALYPHDEAPDQVTTVGWRVGAGSVLGLGAGIRFVDEGPEHVVDNRDRLVRNALSMLATEGLALEGRPKSIDGLTAARDRLGPDPHVPRYHLTPPANWLNDPNGLIEYEGTYHAFYQYNPGGPYHNSIHWGHAVSEDLVTWSDRPVALTPDPDGPDRDGCWSGCAVDVGEARLLYTGGRGTRQLPCLATATDSTLDRFEKTTSNPVIDDAPTDPRLRSSEHWDAEFRDHCLLEFDGVWHHFIGSGVEDGGGTTLVYTCPDDDLTEWTYRGPIMTGEPERDGGMWECPEILTFEDADLMHISNYRAVRYYLGQYDPESYQFDSDSTGLLDHGCWYAPQSLDDGDRWLTWGWIKEDRDEHAQWDAGWSGALSVPRVIDLDDHGQLRQRPAAELEDLRGRTLCSQTGTARLTDETRTLEAGGRHLELETTIRLDDADAFELTLCETPDGAERTPIRYTNGNELIVDRAHASLDERTAGEPVSMPITPIDEPLSIRLFLDGSTLEIFANKRHCLTTRLYPTREDATGISIAAIGGTAILESLEAWELGSIWTA